MCCADDVVWLHGCVYNDVINVTVHEHSVHVKCMHLICFNPVTNVKGIVACMLEIVQR